MRLLHKTQAAFRAIKALPYLQIVIVPETVISVIGQNPSTVGSSKPKFPTAALLMQAGYSS